VRRMQQIPTKEGQLDRGVFSEAVVIQSAKIVTNTRRKDGR
jgi:hypothetical protein